MPRRPDGLTREQVNAARRAHVVHGTPGGYVKCRAINGEPCDLCKATRRSYRAALRRASGVPTLEELHPPQPCGTVAAYARHVRRGEPIDSACRAAHSTYVQQWRASREPEP